MNGICIRILTIDLKPNLDYSATPKKMTLDGKALELVIKQSLSRNEDGLITDSAIEEGEQRFGSIDAGGLIMVPATDLPICQ
jgi:hypothetical protein